MTALLVLMAMAVAGVVGWRLGRRRGTADELERARTRDRALRSSLARAWQEGFEAATAGVRAGGPEAAGPTEPAAMPARAGDPVPGRAFPASGPPPSSTTSFAGNGHGTMGPAAPAGVGSGIAAARPVDPHRGAPSPTAEATTLRNINVILYVAAMLLVAAATLLIGLAMPSAAKFGALLVLTAGFYAAGLLVHARSHRLRPAGVAFAGTGLALIPLSGLALSILVVHDGPVAWLATSVVGTVAFAHAAARLDSRVVAYLGVTFLVSSAWAGGAVLNRGLIWYFMFSMVLASAMTAMAYAHPRWLGNLYLRALVRTHRFVAPLTLVGGLVAFGSIGSGAFTLVVVAGTIYYAGTSMFGPATARPLNIAGTRVTATAAAALVAHEMGAGHVGILYAVAICTLAQAAVIHVLGGRYQRAATPGLPYSVTVEPQILVGGVLAIALLANQRGNFGSDAGEGGAWMAQAATINALLPLVALAAACLATPQRRWLPWLALASGYAGLLEPGAATAPWRQVLFLFVGLAGSFAGYRKARGHHRAALSVALVGSLPVLAAVAVAWIATGFPGGGAVERADGRDELLLAGAVAFVLAWLGVCAWAAPRAHSGVLAAGAVLMTLGAGEAALLAARDLGAMLLVSSSVAVVVAAANVVLLRITARPGRTGRRRRLLAHVAATVSVLGAMVLVPEVQNRWLLVVVLVVALVHAIVRTFGESGPVGRGAFTLAAQVLFTWLLVEYAGQLDADVHVRWALAVVSLTAGQLALHFLCRHPPSSPQLAYRHGLAWLVLVVLVLVPLMYLVAVTAGNPSGADRATLMVHYLCLFAFAVVKWRADVRLAVDGAGPVGQPRAGGRSEWSGPMAVRHLQILLAVYAAMWLTVIPSDAIGFRAGGWLPEPWWGVRVVLAVFLFMAVVALLGEAASPTARLRQVSARWATGNGAVPAPSAAYSAARALVVGTCLLSVLVLAGGADAQGAGPLLSATESLVWSSVAILVAAAACSVHAFTGGWPLLLLGSLAFLPVAGMQWLVLADGSGGVWPPEAGTQALAMSLVGAGGYAVGWLRRGAIGVPVRFATQPRTWGRGHARVLSGGGLLLVALGGMLTHHAGGLLAAPDAAGRQLVLQLTGTAMLAVAAGAVVFELPRSWHVQGFEAAFLVVAACLQHGWHLVLGRPEAFWAVQYWVVVLALLAVGEYTARRHRALAHVLTAASVLLSASIPWALAQGAGWGQAWLLSGHVMLVVGGALWERRRFVLWGAIGAGLMVLWFLRGFTIVLLALLALGLIALAIWRLQALGRARDGAGATADSKPADAGGR